MTSNPLPRRLHFVPASVVIPIDMKSDIPGTKKLIPPQRHSPSDKVVGRWERIYPIPVTNRVNSTMDSQDVLLSSPTNSPFPAPSQVLYSDAVVRSRLKWPTIARVGSGLHNLDEHTNECVIRNDDFCALCALTELIRTVNKSDGSATAPRKIVGNIRRIGRQFRVGRQEDAHEFVRLFTEAMHKTFLRCRDLPTEFYDGLDPRVAETSVIYRMFGGYLRSQIKCSRCGFTSDSFDSFLDLSLEIQRATSVAAALKHFTAVETLEGDNAYRCAKCDKKVKATKQLSIYMPSNTLCVQLKRFSSASFHSSKIDKHVEYGETLDLSPYVSVTSENIIAHRHEEMSYHLYGVIVHVGHSLHGGHYFAYCKASNGAWYCLDDSCVRQVGVQRVLQQRAYLLFYIRNVISKSIDGPKLSSTTKVASPRLSPLTPATPISPIKSEIKVEDKINRGDMHTLVSRASAATSFFGLKNPTKSRCALSSVRRILQQQQIYEKQRRRYAEALRTIEQLKEKNRENEGENSKLSLLITSWQHRVYPIAMGIRSPQAIVASRDGTSAQKILHANNNGNQLTCKSKSSTKENSSAILSIAAREEAELELAKLKVRSKNAHVSGLPYTADIRPWDTTSRQQLREKSLSRQSTGDSYRYDDIDAEYDLGKVKKVGRTTWDSDLKINHPNNAFAKAFASKRNRDEVGVKGDVSLPSKRPRRDSDRNKR